MTKVLQRDDALHCRLPLDCTHEQHRRILGVFDDWQMYTDGITEAQNSEGEEFGDRRLSDLLIGLQGAVISSPPQQGEYPELDTSYKCHVVLGQHRLV